MKAKIRAKLQEFEGNPNYIPYQVKDEASCR